MRYDLRFGLHVLRAGDQDMDGSGETINVSSNGVLFRCDSEIDIGKTVVFVLKLFTDESAGKRIELLCRGVVVRLEEEPPGRWYRVAARLEGADFARV